MGYPSELVSYAKTSDHRMWFTVVLKYNNSDYVKKYISSLQFNN